MKTGEKTNYSTNTIEMADVDSLIFIEWQTDSVFNQNTQTWSIDSIPLYDSTTITTYINDSIFYNAANKYTWISIPLRFGYRFDMNKFSIIPRVGIDLSFAMGSNTEHMQSNIIKAWSKSLQVNLFCPMPYSLRSEGISNVGMYL